MSMDNAMRQTVLAALLVPILLAAGCSTTRAVSAGHTAAARQLCPSNRTPACVEYLGKKLRCTCSTLDDLERILEPDPLFR